MHKRTKSLLEELQAVGNNRDINHVIENRANNIITSAINLVELINRHFDKEKAELLERKLLSAIKGKDERKFSKSLRKNHASESDKK
jgi:hemerythrin-like domain-containing protein